MMRLSKVSLFLSLLVWTIGSVDAGWKVVSQKHDNRQLFSGQDGFLHSLDDGKEWCITASENKLDDQVYLQLCLFDAAPSSQLWLYQDGKYKSKLDYTKCMTINRDIFTRGRSRVRLMDCDDDVTDLNMFDHHGPGQIEVLEYDTFCLTSQGVNANEGARIIALECADTERFIFYFVGIDGEDDYNPNIIGLCNDDAYPESGCLTVEDENPQAGQGLILGNPSLNHDWVWYDDFFGLFYSTLDDSMCLQAGHGEEPGPGTRLRLYPCDETNPLQHFDYDGVDIELKGSNGLCVGFAGANSEVDEDPIILKDCEKNGNNWSQDN